jgi:glutathione peroxidase
MNPEPQLFRLAAILAAALLMVGPAGAAVYVVDQTAPGAADDNPGTEAKPFKTVQKAADVVQPGDTVYVMAGNYPERVTVKTSGAEGKPITFEARPRRSAVVGGFTLQAGYVRVVGFEITWSEPKNGVELDGSHCEVLDNYIHHMWYAVRGTNGKLDAEKKRREYSAVSHNRLAYNQVYHSEFGFILGGNEWLVENNEVSRLFMYAEGKGHDDCDYTRFFGRGCVQRYNYYHGTISRETKQAHVDGIQSFAVNGETAEDLVFEDNVVCDWGQGCMVSVEPNVGHIRRFTFRRNLFTSGTPAYRGAWGVNLIDVPDVTIENNTFASIVWFGAGLRGKNATNGRIAGNLFYDISAAVNDKGRPETGGPVIERNLAFKVGEPLKGETNINGQDPLFVDATNRNFRLRPGSPAIASGADQTTLGALAWPNAWYVDPRHPAAADLPAWGYPAVPLATVSRALDVAEPGETIVLRGGVYRLTLAPTKGGLTLRAMPGEKVIVSGADLVEGWRREADGSWTVALAAAPKKLLRDGQPWADFVYDAETQRLKLAANAGDPRCHVFENVVRDKGLVLDKAGDTKVEGIEVVNLLEASAGGAKSPSAVDFTVKNLAGQEVALARAYAGKVLLVVNVASKCGFTKQYTALQGLHDKYAEKGLAVLGFPCNQFGGQEPGTNDEIKEFCQTKYAVKFDLFDKIDVNGDQASPLYKYLTGPDLPVADRGPVKWNFEKFLVGRNGQVIARYRSAIKPEDLAADIEKALAQK